MLNQDNQPNDRDHLHMLVIDDNEAIHAEFRNIFAGDPDGVSSHTAALLGAEEPADSSHPEFEIDSAYQGRQGLDMVRQALQEHRPYTVAFVGIRMSPGWDGIETVERLWKEYSNLQVVLCTAFSDFNWKEIVSRLGHSDQLLILKKPFDCIEVRQMACALARKWELAQLAEANLGHLKKMVAERTAELAANETRLRAIIETAHDCIISADRAGKIIEFNPAAESTFGYNRQAVLGKSVGDLIVPRNLKERHRRGLDHYLATGEGPVLNKRLELTALRRDGSEFPIEITVTAVPDKKHPVFTAIFHDITERRDLEQQLQHRALHDSLTELPNRMLILDRLEHSIKLSTRRAGYLFALLFLDLDRFKNINDSLGHQVGDQILFEMAKRLRKCVRASDTVARLGGDEFVVLVDDISDVSDAIHVAERILEAQKQPFQLDGKKLFATASIGIAVSSTGYDRADDVLRDADTAMYQAKHEGKARYRLFESDMHAHANEVLDLEMDLRRAVEQCEFRNFYQPIISLETGRIIGFEALARWMHPERGLLPPSEFLKLAEDTGLLVPIGWMLLREACSQLREWQEISSETAALTMSVNTSPGQIMQPDLVAKVAQIANECGIDTQNLILEVTEDTLIENADLIATCLSKLKATGIRLAIDDFGTGYASLSYLYRFPFDILKIDRSFISAADNREGNWYILRSIVEMAHSLDLVVVAEGVETIAQCARLEAMKCERGQGYLFSKPKDRQAVTEMLGGHVPVVQVAAVRRHSVQGGQRHIPVVQFADGPVEEAAGCPA